MRCPSCGTKNEADSRFCGGCGARLTPSRLAPTQKIADNAPLQAVAPAQPVSGRTSAERLDHRAPSVSQPPPVQPMAPSVNRPPRSGDFPVRPISQVAPPVSAQPDDSLPAPPQRRWGLIIGVLVIDLGLAAAGAYLLGEGLQSAGPAKPAPTTGSATVKTGSADTKRVPASKPVEPTPIKPAPIEPAPAAAMVAPPAPAPLAVPDPETIEPPAKAAAAASPPKARPQAPRVKATKPRAKGTTSTPLDPYADPPPPRRASP